MIRPRTGSIQRDCNFSLDFFVLNVGIHLSCIVADEPLSFVGGTLRVGEKIFILREKTTKTNGKNFSPRFSAHV